MVESPAPVEDAPERPKLSRRKKFFFGAVAFLVLSCITVGGVELYYRIDEDMLGGLPGHPSVNEDPYCRYIQKPNLDIPYYAGQHTHLRTNSFGFRGPETTREKPAGVFRILCMGGSTTWGFGATENATTYPHRLQQMLSSAYPDRAIEVVNAGVPGWNSRLSLTFYQKYLDGFGFDLVVVMHGLNDIYENGSAVYRRESRAQGPDDMFQQKSWYRRLLAKSVAYHHIQRRSRKRDLKRHKIPELQEKGRKSFERNLRAIVEYSRKRGARVLLCTFPHVYPESYEVAKGMFPEVPNRIDDDLKYFPLVYSALTDGLREYNETIRTVARETATTLADVADVLPRDVELYVDFIHHNNTGQRRKARIIQRVIVAEEWVDSGEG